MPAVGLELVGAHAEEGEEEHDEYQRRLYGACYHGVEGLLAVFAEGKGAEDVVCQHAHRHGDRELEGAEEGHFFVVIRLCGCGVIAGIADIAGIEAIEAIMAILAIAAISPKKPLQRPPGQRVLSGRSIE